MIWLLSALAVSALFGLAAAAAERWMRGAGRGARWAWLVAMLLSVAWLLLALVGRLPSLMPESAQALTRAPFGGELPAPRVGGRTLLVLWLALSIPAGCLLLSQLWRLTRLRRGWRSARISGVPVLLSARTGPATLGWLRPRIVLPAWVLELDLRSQRIIVLHEQEHRRAGDVLLLNAAALLVVLVPWNAVLWWHAARLHRAIEMDCDARVLRRVRDRTRYGRVLLAAAERAMPSPPLAVALGPDGTLLERRLRVLLADRPPRWRRAAGCVAFALAVAACVMPAPFEPDGPATLVEVPAGNVMRARGVVTPRTAPGGTLGRYEYDSPAVIRQRLPELRVRGGAGGRVTRVSPPPTDPTARR